MENKKTALITGANKGIGFEIARQLGKKGFHVIISGRNENRIYTAAKTLQEEGINNTPLLMDISDKQSIEKARLELTTNNVKLSVLVNNAAILLQEDKDIFQDISILEKTLATNVYGAILVTQAFIPLLENGARIVNISSGGGSLNDDVGGWSPAYCVSKTLLNSVTKQMAYFLSTKNITVNAVCPGWVKTDMGGKNAPRTVEKGAETPVWLCEEAPNHYTGLFFRDKQVIPW
jgi:NAD(P)-dependent dehydrogenase (short-subunit alcohol dehydrogenase family)